MLEGYVNEVKEVIGCREIVVFFNVGCLYQDYENNLQFLLDGNNYDLDFYGFFMVSFYLVVCFFCLQLVKECFKKVAVKVVFLKVV